ncbi:MAG: PaaI family thioesterase [Caulobacterales bacterium]
MSINDSFGGRLGQVYADTSTQRLGFYVTEDQSNPVNGCHGGALATFADMQLLAIPGEVGGALGHKPTISLSVDYFAPIELGSWVEAKVIVERETRSMVFTQAHISVGGRPVARATAIYHNRAIRTINNDHSSV